MREVSSTVTRAARIAGEICADRMPCWADSARTRSPIRDDAARAVDSVRYDIEPIDAGPIVSALNPTTMRLDESCFAVPRPGATLAEIPTGRGARANVGENGLNATVETVPAIVEPL